MKKITLTFFSILFLIIAGFVGKSAGSAAFAESALPEGTSVAASSEIRDYAYTVYIDGELVENSSYQKDGVMYMKLSDIAAALDLDVSLTDNQEFSFNWRKSSVIVSVEDSIVEYNGSKRILTADTIGSNDNTDLFVPAKSFFDAIEVGVFDDTEESTIYFTPAAGHWAVPKGYNVAVMMYHGVGHADIIANLTMPPTKLEEQLQYIVDNGYTTIGFEDLWHVEDFEKPVILIFDDGVENTYRYLLPLLEKYDCKATVAVVGNYTSEGQQSYLDAPEILEMQATGLVSFQSHTVSHRYLELLGEEEQIWEMEESQKFFTRLTKKEPFVLVYPFGSVNDTTLSLVRNFYDFGVMMHHKPGDCCYNTSDDSRMIYRFFPQSFTPIQQYSGWLEYTFSEEAYSRDPITVDVKTVSINDDCPVDESTAIPDSINVNEASEDFEYVYLGEYLGEPIKWKVLDSSLRNDGEPGMFLISEYVLDEYGTNYADQLAGWEGSNAQKWCSEFYDSSFSEVEKAIIPAVSKAEESCSLFGLTWKETSLNDEKVFFISAPEVAEYIGDHDGVEGINAYLPNGFPSYWWLRTSHFYHPDYAGLVLQGNQIHDCQVASSKGTRPAMNIDTSNILAFTDIEELPDGRELVIIDENRSFTAELKDESSDALTVDYSGAFTGEGEYICCLIKAGDGSVKSINVLTPAELETGSISISKTDYSLESGDALCLISCKVTPDYYTDYSSAPVVVYTQA